MSIYEIDTGGVERIRGTLHTTGGAPGDVPVQQANGQLLQAPGGGSTPIFGIYSGNVVSIGNGMSGQLTFDTFEGGTQLFDLSQPQFPVVLADGFYMLIAQVSVEENLTAGGKFLAQTDPSNSPAASMTVQSASVGAPSLQVVNAAQMSAGDSWTATVDNEDGVLDHTFVLGSSVAIKFG